MPFIAALIVLFCLGCRAIDCDDRRGNPAEVRIRSWPLRGAGARCRRGALRPNRGTLELIAAVLLIVSALIGRCSCNAGGGAGSNRHLIDSQQRYSLASAAGAVGVWDWNFETNELFIDSRLKSILGFDDAEISTRPRGLGIESASRRTLPTRPRPCRHASMATPTRYEVEHRMLHKNGSVKWMLSRGSAMRSRGRHSCDGWSAPRWTSPSAKKLKSRFARTRPCSGRAISRFTIWPGC